MALPHMNNEQLVLNLMNFSVYGALSPMFVRAALDHYIDFVIENGPAQLREEERVSKHLFISTESWIAVAEEIKQKITDNNNNNG